ncbi:MAG: nucleotidyltransferase domain-containing protein [Bacteroidota bacterium]|nr:nucleotidyltransferase domain-containing protein [Bacteroidota bacterium]
MNDFGISTKSYDEILKAFTRFPEVEEVIIFGSRAKGNYKKGSDIDLAIKGKNCNSVTALNIATMLNEEIPIPYHVDVVALDDLNHLELKEHILRVGKLFLKN